ncbi:hypothetical protein Bpfe_008212 [Biomphalaria pfeifferi]|uniref:Uncharacterized protein n=1 Tax=Biomphalaria pfeifferi TaxID=112525 RepID=A0AAD8FGH1_BIOPF|nr:hypothetical protein Bpfe_008212 [Biomphalaria pfeifferi]
MKPSEGESNRFCIGREGDRSQTHSRPQDLWSGKNNRETSVKVLRDTWSTVMVVPSNLAPKLTGRFKWIKTIDSTMLKVATHLLNNPLYDCVAGAANPFRTDPDWRDAPRVTF